MIVITLALVVATLSAVFFVVTGGFGGAEPETDVAAVGPAEEADVSAEAGRGGRVFESSCSGCHYDDSAEMKVGPGLAGLFARDVIGDSGKPVTPGNVREQIVSPAGGMPSFKGFLTDEQLDDLLSYLETL